MTDQTIMILDALGTIRFCSNPLLFKGSAEQLHGRPLASLMPTLSLKDGQPAHNIAYAKFWWAEGPWRYHPLRTLDGHSIGQEACLRTVMIDRKQRLLVVLRSPANATQKSGNIQRLFIAAENWLESCFITAMDAVIGFGNPTVEKLTGYRRSDHSGQKPRMLASRSRRSAISAAIKAEGAHRSQGRLHA